MSSSTAACLRPYQDSDQSAILRIFEANIREEWSKYHNAQYLPNAERYIESCLSLDSDLNNIPSVYRDNGGGQFWVLEDPEKQEVVGMCGLQITRATDDNQPIGEVRRNCLLPDYRRQGWGTRMVRSCLEWAREKSIPKVICSTPEHGLDVLAFYSKLGFVDTHQRANIHGSPVQEVFLECELGARNTAS